MRKLIVIIILLISSFSYYGVVDENGEKVTVFENVVEKQNIVEQIQEENKTTEKIIEEYENTETQNQVEDLEQEKIEIPKVQETQNQTTKNTVKQQTTTITSKANNTSTNKDKTTVNTQQNSSYTEKEVKVAEKTECVGNNHKMKSGNTGKWFNTKTEADNYYNAEIEKWGKQWENDEITKEEYLKKCPSGYEVWTCPQCQKWTLNFYYR